MTDSHDSSTSLPELIRQFALDQLARMASLLSTPGHLQAERIHETRKAGKRVRAALQLIRDDLGKRYQDWEGCLQTVHRELSAARDFDACQQTIENVLPACSAPQKQVLERLSMELMTQRDALRDRLSPEACLRLADQIHGVQHSLTEWFSDQPGFQLVRPAVRRMTRQARRMIKHLREQSSSEDMHRLRKLAKLRLYWLEILQPLWPYGFHAEAKMVDALAERLGYHHDLDVLLEQLKNSAVAQDPWAARHGDRLQQRLTARQRKLEARALQLAQRLFVERPAAISRRWAGLAKIWTKSQERRCDQPAAEQSPSRPRPR